MIFNIFQILYFSSIKISSFLDILQNVSFDWTKILRSIYMIYTDDTRPKLLLSTNISWMLAPEYPSCQTIDISKYFDLNIMPPMQIFFNFFKLKNMGVSLHILEKNKALKRPLKER